MRVEVRYFASLAERTGCRSETVDVERGRSVAELWGALVERHPALAEIGFEPLVACDLQWVDWERRLDGVSEIVFLPPFSGG